MTKAVVDGASAAARVVASVTGLVAAASALLCLALLVIVVIATLAGLVSAPARTLLLVLGLSLGLAALWAIERAVALATGDRHGYCPTSGPR